MRTHDMPPIRWIRWNPLQHISRYPLLLYKAADQRIARTTHTPTSACRYPEGHAHPAHLPRSRRQHHRVRLLVRGQGRRPTNPPARQQGPAVTRGGSTWAWRQLRAAVLRRDGWTCQLCGDPLHPRCSRSGCGQCAHVDHRLPVAAGGVDHPANLRAACQRCNLSRANSVRTGSAADLGGSRAW